MRDLHQAVTQEIRAEMARQRVSQRALADRLGWKQPYLQRRLAGEVQIGLSDLGAIASVLNISVVQLVWPAGTAAPSAPGRG